MNRKLLSMLLFKHIERNLVIYVARYDSEKYMTYSINVLMRQVNGISIQYFPKEWAKKEEVIHFTEKVVKSFLMFALTPPFVLC